MHKCNKINAKENHAMLKNSCILDKVSQIGVCCKVKFMAPVQYTTYITGPDKALLVHSFKLFNN